MKKLTLKQLYGFSIMNWEQFKNNFELAIKERGCSFCRDAGWKCGECKINKVICGDKSSSIYHDIFKAENRLYTEINNMIFYLREEYFGVK